MNIDAEAFIVYMTIFIVFSLVSLLTARCTCTYMSEAGLLLLTGVVGGGFVKLLVKEDKNDMLGEREVEEQLVRFSSEILFCILLPPIIFKSGYDMQGKAFWANIDKILALAFLGTSLSTFIVGVGLYGMRASFGMVDLSMPEALAFGALISATDPVTTLAIFEQLHVDQDLFNVVFGESVLNDAVSIVLYHTLIKYKDRTDSVSIGDVAFSLGEIAWIFGGSLTVGVLMALGAAVLFKFAQLRTSSMGHGKQLELALFVLACYAPFLLAEALDLSGIVAILFAGVVTRRYASTSLSEETRDRSESIIGVLAYAAEALIFIELGTCAWRPFHASIQLVLFVLLLCMFARAAHVYPIGGLMNLCHCKAEQQHFKKNHMHMVWFSGLRGAIAYALSTQFPGQYGDNIASLTMAVVLLTIWFMGGATETLLRCLGIAMGVGAEHEQVKVDEESNLKDHEESNFVVEMSPTSPNSLQPKPVAVGRSLEAHALADGDELDNSDGLGAQDSEPLDRFAHGAEGA